MPRASPWHITTKLTLPPLPPEPNFDWWAPSKITKKRLLAVLLTHCDRSEVGLHCTLTKRIVALSTWGLTKPWSQCKSTGTPIFVFVFSFSHAYLLHRDGKRIRMKPVMVIENESAHSGPFCMVLVPLVGLFFFYCSSNQLVFLHSECS